MDHGFEEKAAKEPPLFDAGPALTPLARPASSPNPMSHTDPQHTPFQPGQLASAAPVRTFSDSAVSLFGGMYDGPAPRNSRGSDGELPLLLENDPEYLSVAGRISAAERGTHHVERPAPAKEGHQMDTKGKKAAAPEMTGIGSSVAVGRFVSAAKKVQSDWEKLTPNDRASGFTRAANEELAAVGVPEVKKELADLGGRAGEFDSEIWQMNFGEGPFSRSEIGDGEAGSMADTVYHESRHAEQSHRIARLLAGQRKTATVIAGEMEIPKRVADTAVAKPLDGNTAEGKEAQIFYESEYGKDADRQTQIRLDMAKRKQERKDAEDAVVKINDDPKAPLEQKAAAEKNWQAARKAWKEIYQQYRALPDEADAWKVGTAVSQKYTEKR